MTHLKEKVGYAARLLTAPLRTLPDFIIAGEAKCGTTSLYSYLKLHPNILTANIKEPNNFIKFTNSELHCRMHYPLLLTHSIRAIYRGKVLAGEASAEYLSKSDVPEYIHDILPRVKIIVLMRNPVHRAYSDYQMLRNRFVTEDFHSLVCKAVEWLEDDTLKPLVESASQREYNPLRFVERGLYHEHISRWIDHFDREAFHFVKSEDLFHQPAITLQHVQEFLEIPLREFNYNFVSKQGNYSGDMESQTERILYAFYKSHNERLYQFLGRDLGWEAAERGL